MPQGKSLQHEVPSCLDYPIMHPNLNADVLATWMAAPADHAWIQIRLNIQTLTTTDTDDPTTTRRMPIGRPTSYEEATRDMQRQCDTIDMTTMPWTNIRDMLIELQKKWHEPKTAKQRRYDRVPTQARHC